MKYCTRCGTEMNDSATVCPTCGYPVAGSGATTDDTIRTSGYEKGWNVMCIVGFILSFFVAIAGLICSILGRRQAIQSGEKGKDLATAGIVLSAVGIASGFFLVVFYIVFVLLMII